MKCRLCNKKIVQLQDRSRKRCNACNTKVRRTRAKIKAIALLGGKCARCGFNEHPAALQFHHKVSADKEFNFGMWANKSWAVLEPEVLKCELLCANCHGIHHSNRFDEMVMEEARYLRGKRLW